MWKISNENDIFKKRKPLPPKKSEESQPELTPWQKQNQEYLKKQAEEAALKGENEQAEVTITLQEQSQEEPQQHLPGALFLIQITIVGRFVCMVIVQTENAIWHILHYVLQKKATMF